MPMCLSWFISLDLLRVSRLSPFYEVEDVVEHIEQYIKERCSDFRFMDLLRNYCISCRIPCAKSQDVFDSSVQMGL